MNLDGIEHALKNSSSLGGKEKTNTGENYMCVVKYKEGIVIIRMSKADKVGEELDNDIHSSCKKSIDNETGGSTE